MCEVPVAVQKRGGEMALVEIEGCGWTGGGECEVFGCPGTLADSLITGWSSKRSPRVVMDIGRTAN